MTLEKTIELLHPNTTKEAIRRIEENGGDAIKAIEEACVIACEALEKQVPKKPIAVPPRMDKVFCPNCRHMQTFANEYCYWCNQKLDWGEDDDKEG